MSMYIYKLLRISISMDVDIKKLILKFTWKRLKRANTILKNKVRELIPPNFKTYYKTTVIKPVYYW